MGFILMIWATPALLIPALAPFAPVQAVGGLAVILLAAERLIAHRGITLVWPESYLLLAFLWIAGLSIFDAAWMRLSLETTIDLAKYVVLFMLIVNTVTTERRLRLAMMVMVAGGMVPALGTLKNYVTGNIHEGERVHWVGIFANSNDLAYSMVILIPIAGALFMASRMRSRVVLLGAVAILMATAFVTFSRGGMLGLVAVLGLFGLKQGGAQFKAAVVALLVLSVLAAGAFWSRDEGFTDLGSDATVNERIVTMRTGMEMFFDRPVLGVGLGGSVAAFPDYLPENSGFDQALVIHNTPIMALAEVGLLGTLAFGFLIGAALIRARHVASAAASSGKTDLGRLMAGLEVAMWGFLVCGLAGGYVMSWFPYILIALIATSDRFEQTNDAVQGG
jgi:O-antigen ligase